MLLILLQICVKPHVPQILARFVMHQIYFVDQKVTVFPGIIFSMGNVFQDARAIQQVME